MRWSRPDYRGSRGMRDAATEVLHRNAGGGRPAPASCISGHTCVRDSSPVCRFTTDRPQIGCVQHACGRRKALLVLHRDVRAVQLPQGCEAASLAGNSATSSLCAGGPGAWPRARRRSPRPARAATSCFLADGAHSSRPKGHFLAAQSARRRRPLAVSSENVVLVVLDGHAADFKPTARHGVSSGAPGCPC
jgi:hypothetical protein